MNALFMIGYACYLSIAGTMCVETHIRASGAAATTIEECTQLVQAEMKRSPVGTNIAKHGGKNIVSASEGWCQMERLHPNNIILYHYDGTVTVEMLPQ